MPGKLVSVTGPLFGVALVCEALRGVLRVGVASAGEGRSAGFGTSGAGTPMSLARPTPAMEAAYTVTIVSALIPWNLMEKRRRMCV
jgi:hypothetical protein